MKNLIELISFIIDILYKFESKNISITELKDCKDIDSVFKLVHEYIVRRFLYEYKNEDSECIDIILCNIHNEMSIFYELNYTEKRELLYCFDIATIMTDYSDEYEQKIKSIKNYANMLKIDFEKENKFTASYVKDLILFYNEYHN